MFFLFLFLLEIFYHIKKRYHIIIRYNVLVRPVILVPNVLYEGYLTPWLKTLDTFIELFKTFHSFKSHNVEKLLFRFCRRAQEG